MKIEKRKIKASAEQLDTLDPVLAPEGPVIEEELVEEVPVCSYEECIQHIHDAIDCLATCAKEDPIAKESIANLSVVLLDLQQA